jgi:cytochrome c2
MKMFVSAMVAGLLFVAVQDAQAFDPMGGNALWGKYAIQTCRSCHKEKGLTSLDPHERSVEKWEEFFADDYKKLREMDHDFSKAGINDRQVENIHRYLVETAAKGGTKTTVAATPKKTTIRSSSTVKKSAVKSSTVKKGSTPKKEGGKKFDMAAGDAGKGRYIFRKCLSCHKKNKAPIISPGDRTKKAWDRFFASDFRKFKKAMPKFDTYKYSISQMEHLHQFFRKYALDADKPKTCE